MSRRRERAPLRRSGKRRGTPSIQGFTVARSAIQSATTCARGVQRNRRKGGEGALAYFFGQAESMGYAAVAVAHHSLVSGAKEACCKRVVRHVLEAQSWSSHLQAARARIVQPIRIRVASRTLHTCAQLRDQLHDQPPTTDETGNIIWICHVGFTPIVDCVTYGIHTCTSLLVMQSRQRPEVCSIGKQGGLP